jgi:hypothetical protein
MKMSAKASSPDYCESLNDWVWLFNGEDVENGGLPLAFFADTDKGVIKSYEADFIDGNTRLKISDDAPIVLEHFGKVEIIRRAT